jgi:hypothetical protein
MGNRSVGDGRSRARQVVIELHNHSQHEIGDNTIRSLWRFQGNWGRSLGQSVPLCVQVFGNIPEDAIQ